MLSLTLFLIWLNKIIKIVYLIPYLILGKNTIYVLHFQQPNLSQPQLELGEPGLIWIVSHSQSVNLFHCFERDSFQVNWKYGK